MTPISVAAKYRDALNMDKTLAAFTLPVPLREVLPHARIRFPVQPELLHA